ncbi:hypothetical protein GIB67_041872 [Kingdonia uniflora]|uniref:Uncharacterized protein n=1 Tax=Kingdonia uniflora TaxID=39325 RepID=A0A7J7L615_9MAGN|nr:hypothetical protein GIB67_041872 [Kingdonia uniflora]
MYRYGRSISDVGMKFFIKACSELRLRLRIILGGLVCGLRGLRYIRVGFELIVLRGNNKCKAKLIQIKVPHLEGSLYLHPQHLYIAAHSLKKEQHMENEVDPDIGPLPGWHSISPSPNLEGLTDSKIRALELAEELRAIRANKQGNVVNAFDMERNMLPLILGDDASDYCSNYDAQ